MSEAIHGAKNEAIPRAKATLALNLLPSFLPQGNVLSSRVDKYQFRSNLFPRSRITLQLREKYKYNQLISSIKNCFKVERKQQCNPIDFLDQELH